MAVYVSGKTYDTVEGVEEMKKAMMSDYAGWSNRSNSDSWDSKIALKMYDDYCDNLTESYGSKYIKIFLKGGGVKAFIVNTDKDKKFKKGDILKPAGWAAPARNFARGNVLEGGYEIRWTGA